MIKNFDKKLNWDPKYIPNFSVTRLIGPRQLECANLTGRLQKVSIWDVYKILPSDFRISSICDEQVFGRKEKYINDQHILKIVSVIDAFIQENFPNVQIRHK